MRVNIYIFIEERKKRASKNCVTVQPFIIVVAPTLAEMVTCYVSIVDCVGYKINNRLQAVVNFFKLFHVLNIKERSDDQNKIFLKCFLIECCTLWFNLYKNT